MWRQTFPAHCARHSLPRGDLRLGAIRDPRCQVAQEIWTAPGDHAQDDHQRRLALPCDTDLPSVRFQHCPLGSEYHLRSGARPRPTPFSFLAYSACLCFLDSNGNVVQSQCEDCVATGWFDTFYVLLKAPFDDVNQIDTALPHPVAAFSKTFIMLYEVGALVSTPVSAPRLTRWFVCAEASAPCV